MLVNALWNKVILRMFFQGTSFCSLFQEVRRHVKHDILCISCEITPWHVYRCQTLYIYLGLASEIHFAIIPFQLLYTSRLSKSGCKEGLNIRKLSLHAFSDFYNMLKFFEHNIMNSLIIYNWFYLWGFRLDCQVAFWKVMIETRW